MEMDFSGCKTSFSHTRPKKEVEVQIKVGNLRQSKLSIHCMI